MSRGSRRAERPEPAELRALLSLVLTPGLGAVTLGELLRQHGSARAALLAPGAVPPAEPGDRVRLRGRLERSLALLAAEPVHVLTPASPRYPGRLAALHDPPPVLFGRGDLDLLDRRAVAIVGARRSTEYGRSSAARIASALGAAGLCVVSGLARGIDAAAHAAALDSGTIAVLGCGVDVDYPPCNARLKAEIGRRGLVLTEFPPGEPALRHNFPRRNRILAALAEGVVVVEAGVRSGALITVGHALDLGREIFAVPGPIDRPGSAGTNALIRDGARLVTDPADILDELGLPGPRGAADAASAPPLEGVDRVIWGALDAGALHVDALALAAGLPAGAMLSALLAMELRGHVRQLPGLRFARARGAEPSPAMQGTMES